MKRGPPIKCKEKKKPKELLAKALLALKENEPIYQVWLHPQQRAPLSLVNGLVVTPDMKVQLHKMSDTYLKAHLV